MAKRILHRAGAMSPAFGTMYQSRVQWAAGSTFLTVTYLLIVKGLSTV